MTRRFTIFSRCALSRLRSAPTVLALAFMAGCAARVTKPVNTAGTLADLRKARPDVQDVKVEQGLEQAMQNYRRFLEESPETAMTPEAMRRLADLQLEKQFGIRTSNAKPLETSESDQDFERRTTAERGITAAGNTAAEPEG